MSCTREERGKKGTKEEGERNILVYPQGKEVSQRARTRIEEGGDDGRQKTRELGLHFSFQCAIAGRDRVKSA